VLDAGGDLLLNLLGELRVGSVADALAFFVLHIGGCCLVVSYLDRCCDGVRWLMDEKRKKGKKRKKR